MYMCCLYVCVCVCVCMSICVYVLYVGVCLSVWMQFSFRQQIYLYNVFVGLNYKMYTFFVLFIIYWKYSKSSQINPLHKLISPINQSVSFITKIGKIMTTEYFLIFSKWTTSLNGLTEGNTMNG